MTKTPRSSEKRIAVLAGKLHPFGGIETHLFHYCVALSDTASVTLIVTSTTYNANAIAALRSHGVKVSEFSCDRTPVGIFHYLRCLFLLWKQHRNAILYSNGTSGFSYLAKIVARPREWIHHHHGDITPAIVKEFSFLYRKTLRTVDWLILCTEGHAKLIQQAYHRKTRTITLPYLKAEAPASAPIRTKLTRSKTVVGFFGRLREAKGVSLLLGLAPWFRAHEIECRLHGDNCEGLISGELPESVTWRGPYDSSADLDGLLSDIDMVVLPSTFGEGLPIVMCEAISRGVPAVCFPAGGLREMRTFHPGVLIVAPNAEDLKAGVIEMMERSRQPGFARDLAGRYRERLSNQTTIDWWLNLLRRCR